tara:strand:+ start:292 stop:1011 length:720 start_codon:yes stop_codon:yes gene_type:complete
MGKFGTSFMMKSPIKKHGDQYREKARKLSEKSGTPGDYNRDDPKVNKQLDKADKADAEHKDSPLEGAYTSGAGGQAYVSNRQDFQQLQDRIASATISIIAGENDPQTQLERAQKKKARKQEKFDNLVKGKNLEIKKGVTDPDGNAVYYDKITGEVNTRASKLQQQAAKLDKKAKAAQDLLEQRAKNKRTTTKLTAAEKMEITKQHYLSEGNKSEDDWNALTPKAKKEAVLEYRTYYGFN